MKRLTERKDQYIHIIGSSTNIDVNCELPLMKCAMKLAAYEDTELTPQNIICREDDIKLLQQQNKEFREEILKLKNQRQLDIAELQDISFCLIDMHDECVKWEREAIESKTQLGEIRILAGMVN